MNIDFNYLIAIEASIEAGKSIMEVYSSKEYETSYKEDHSPVTKADLLSSTLITEKLTQTNIPVLSEEGKKVSYQERKNWERLWIVDPLDGTKEFVKGTDEFAVSIGLVEGESPIYGVIYIPTTKEVFFGSKELGSFKFQYDEKESIGKQVKLAIQLPITSSQEDVLVTTGGKRAEDSFFENSSLLENYSYSEISFQKLSSAIKFCRIAEGHLDVYPRNYPCMEWDTAAGQAIVNGIDKSLYEINSGEELVYNKEDLHVPFFLLA